MPKGIPCASGSDAGGREKMLISDESGMRMTENRQISDDNPDI